MKNSNHAAISSLVVSLALFPQAAQAFYSPETGRWLSRDPMAERGGNNLFAFAKNNLLNTVDPTGLCIGACLNSFASPRPSPNASGCKSHLYAAYGSPRELGDLRAVFDQCGGTTLACALTTFTFNSSCRQCGCDWKIIVEVKSICQIYYADPTLYGVTYHPDIEHMFSHELCHCDDAVSILQDMVGWYDSTTYPNSERCEDAKKVYDSTFLSRFTEQEKNKAHLGDKWLSGGKCWAWGEIR